MPPLDESFYKNIPSQDLPPKSGYQELNFNRLYPKKFFKLRYLILGILLIPLNENYWHSVEIKHIL